MINFIEMDAALFELLIHTIHIAYTIKLKKREGFFLKISAKRTTTFGDSREAIGVGNSSLLSARNIPV